MKKADTAILFFSRTAADEAASKTFDPRLGRKGNAAIGQCLIERSLYTLAETKMPVFTSYSNRQKGKCFGTRLANAIEAVYQEGYEKVIAIGNDCPLLTASNLLQVRELLQRNDLVLGPTEQAGLYLIGMHRRCYDREAFVNLNWQSNALMPSWQAYAEQRVETLFWLHAHYDINHSIDFTRFLNGMASNDPWKRRLLAICKGSHYLLIQTHLHYPSPQLGSRLLRGPPSHCTSY